jgi:hypothetical protein
MDAFGKDVLGVIMGMLSVGDAISLALTCKRAHEVFCCRPHWAARLWREAGVQLSVRPRRGKGAKKRNEKRKPETGEKLLKQYRAIHLNRRATYRSLLSLARVMAVAGPREVSEIIELRSAFAGTNLPRRKFVTRGDHVTTCNFPMALVSTQTNELVMGFGMMSPSLFVVDIALAVSRLSSQTTPVPTYGSGRSMLTPARTCDLSIRFSAKQMEDLVARHILCRCGCLLWSEDDSCCS